MEGGNKITNKEPAKRSEIIFCYDARMCNLNGSPDDNQPRKDDKTGKLYVTEFRLKRTIRKWLNEINGMKILLRQELEEIPDTEQIEQTGGFKQLRELAAQYITQLEINGVKQFIRKKGRKRRTNTENRQPRANSGPYRHKAIRYTFRSRWHKL